MEVRTLSEALKTIDDGATSLKIFGKTLCHKELVVLANALKTNRTLTTLVIQYNILGTLGGEVLAKALEVNTTITYLSLYGNHLGSKGGVALVKSLENNKTLTSLDIGANELDHNVCLSLSKVLKKNTTLTSLNLPHNYLRDGRALVLSKNTTLTHLNLENNCIRCKGVVALAEALATNTSLTSLGLSDNAFYEEGYVALAKALETNTTLTSLTMWCNFLGYGYIHTTVIKTFINRNQTITNVIHLVDIALALGIPPTNMKMCVKVDEIAEVHVDRLIREASWRPLAHQKLDKDTASIVFAYASHVGEDP